MATWLLPATGEPQVVGAVKSVARASQARISWFCGRDDDTSGSRCRAQCHLDTGRGSIIGSSTFGGADGALASSLSVAVSWTASPWRRNPTRCRSVHSHQTLTPFKRNQS